MTAASRSAAPDAFAVAGAHLESAVAIADALVSGHGNASLAVAGDTMTFSFDALLSGSMNLNVLLPAQATNQLLASAGGGLTTQFNFTTTEPLTFEATGSVSADESYSQTDFTLVPTTGSNPQGLIAQTSRTQTSRKFAGGGTLPPGTYKVLARADDRPRDLRPGVEEPVDHDRPDALAEAQSGLSVPCRKARGAGR